MKKKKKNRIVLIEYYQPFLRAGRFTGPLKAPQVQQVTKKDAARLRDTYSGAWGLGAKRVVIAKIESVDEVGE